MKRIRSFVLVLIACLLSTMGCATLTTASHFTQGSPMFYSGTRLDLAASSEKEDALSLYRDRYGVEPPGHPTLDLPFSLLLDTIILVPVVLPVVLYQTVFE